MAALAWEEGRSTIYHADVETVRFSAIDVTQPFGINARTE
jgi:hypothetical protein